MKENRHGANHFVALRYPLSIVHYPLLRFLFRIPQAQPFGDVFGTGQFVSVRFRQLGDDGVGGNADGPLGGSQGVFDNRFVLVAADDDTDGCVLVIHALLRVQRLEIEFHFPFVFRLETADFQFDSHETAQPAVE